MGIPINFEPGVSGTVRFSFPGRPDLPCWDLEATQAVELSVSPGNNGLEAQVEINSGNSLYVLIEDAEIPGIRTFRDFLASSGGAPVSNECCFVEITGLEGGHDLQVLDSNINMSRGNHDNLWLVWNGTIAWADPTTGVLSNTTLFELVCEVLVVFDWQLEIAHGPALTVDPECSRGGEQPEQLNKFLLRTSEVLESLGNGNSGVDSSHQISKVVLYDLEWEDCAVCRSQLLQGSSASIWIEVHLDRRYIVSRSHGHTGRQTPFMQHHSPAMSQSRGGVETTEASHVASNALLPSTATSQPAMPGEDAASLTIPEAQAILRAFARWKEVPEPFKMVPA